MKTLTLFLIDIYQKYLSYPLKFTFAKGCRFTPSCSEYAKESISNLGVRKGTLLALRRLIRCHPFTSFKFDPPPINHQSLNHESL